jgi:hypothetical protein
MYKKNRGQLLPRIPKKNADPSAVLATVPSKAVVMSPYLRQLFKTLSPMEDRKISEAQ